MTLITLSYLHTIIWLRYWKGIHYIYEDPPGGIIDDDATIKEVPYLLMLEQMACLLMHSSHMLKTPTTQLLPHSFTIKLWYLLFCYQVTVSLQVASISERINSRVDQTLFSTLERVHGALYFMQKCCIR